MLIFFRNNQFTTIIPLAIYVLLLHWAAIGGHLQPGQFQHANGGLLYGLLFGWCEAKPFVAALTAALLVLMQAVMLNQTADVFRLQGERNWLPGMAYVLAASALPDFLFISPPLIAVFFVLVSLRRLFSTYQAHNTAGAILESAFWIGVSALFYPQAIFLLVAAFIGLVIMRAFQFKEQLTFVIGAFIPFYLAFAAFFWFGRGSELLYSQVNDLFGLYHFKPKTNLSSIMKAVALGLILLLVLLNIGRLGSKKLIQTQKIIAALQWFLVIAGAAAVLQGDMLPAHFVLLMPSVGFFLGIIFTNIRNRRIAEIVHLVMLGFVLFVQYLPK